MYSFAFALYHNLLSTVGSFALRPYYGIASSTHSQGNQDRRRPIIRTIAAINNEEETIQGPC